MIFYLIVPRRSRDLKTKLGQGAKIREKIQTRVIS